MVHLNALSQLGLKMCISAGIRKIMRLASSFVQLDLFISVEIRTSALKIDLGSIWGRFGVALGSVWGLFEID